MKDCPNCWGFQEYNGNIKTVTVETIYHRRMPSEKNTNNKSVQPQIEHR